VEPGCADQVPFSHPRTPLSSGTSGMQREDWWTRLQQDTDTPGLTSRNEWFSVRFFLPCVIAAECHNLGSDCSQGESYTSEPAFLFISAETLVTVWCLGIIGTCVHLHQPALTYLVFIGYFTVICILVHQSSHCIPDVPEDNRVRG